MLSKADARKAEHLQQVVAHLRDRLPGDKARRIEPFLRQYYARVAPDDLLAASVPDLFGAALALWQHVQHRAPGTAKVRVYNPQYDDHGWQSPHTVVEIVNDDMPFLVDSITAELNRHDAMLHLIVHPVIRVRRDSDGNLQELLAADAPAGEGAPESVIHVEVSQKTPDAHAAIREALEGVLRDVRAAVQDWRPMLAKLDAIVAELSASPPASVAPEDFAESLEFLRWARDNHFTLLGFREYELVDSGGEIALNVVPDSGLGIMRARANERVSTSFAALPREVQDRARQPSLLIITKANRRSTVHRPVHMDYVGVKKFDADGRVVGEWRFLGLFTSAVYNRNTRDIPLLRRKVRRVIEASGLAPHSHDGKALLHILENLPRDELFQTSDDALNLVAHGVLELQDRQRTRLFVRADDYGRFFSCLVYVPRERYSTEMRLRIADVLTHAFHGDSIDFTAQVSDDVLARLHFIVRVEGPRFPDYDLPQVEAAVIRATRLWGDDLRDALIEAFGEARGSRLNAVYGGAFHAAYREEYPAQTAVGDVERLEETRASGALGMNLYTRIGADSGNINFKIYHPGSPVPLSDILPMFESMGLRVEEERPYQVKPAGGGDVLWIHDFAMSVRRGGDIDLARVKADFQETFGKVWAGEAENDGFNQLVLSAGLSWREVAVLRAYCKYLRQANITYSQPYMESTLNANPAIARLLVALFHARFDPERPRDAAAEAALAGQVEQALESVAVLDQDRIIRRFLNLIQATVRTNYYQRPRNGQRQDDMAWKPYVSFKLDSRRVEGLPAPLPLFEVWVYSPRVEAVHLRGGKVARGGIRWSDRFEDFRTEVLGLMKAQMVKNAVIVPVGAKGGFVVKRPPAGGGRDALMAEVIDCYKTFMRGLLDITDNLGGDGVLAPLGVARHDADDPYLVVAADKGTATFSDIANGIAAEYDFWLGDAFASGGSAGYDHKGMAITARGAWESVKRHFREIGVDVQTQAFTCVAIGDMAGDVFGNGMLRSRQIRLVAAFNHAHIFVDPDPDPAASYAERERLFKLPRSSWKDYDAGLISKGGGVFERSAKSIPLTAEMRAALGTDAERLAPTELIRVILKAPVDLLYNGGIGTYVKAQGETDAEVGDRTNDACRVNGADLRAKVVGEGGNLGFTQKGRIECAQAGGRVNTDWIDNSGGVDCSDHEVNIKILLNAVVAEGDLTTKQRNELLAEMTEEVGRLVLKANYRQSEAISLEAAEGAALLDQQQRLMRMLEREGRLDRALESLPGNTAMANRQASGRGLTRPEIAVLLSYSKMSLYESLLATDLPEDAYLAQDLQRYFPRRVQERFGARLDRHRLGRELVATSVTNSMVNRVGSTFVNRIAEETGDAPAEIARAYVLTRDAFRVRELWDAIEALDNQVPADRQIAMKREIGRLVERGTFWFLHNLSRPIAIADGVATFGSGVAELGRSIQTILPPAARAQAEARTQAFAEGQVPRELAERIGVLDALAAAPDIVQAARGRDIAIDEVGRIYFEVGDRLGLDWLRGAAVGVAVETHWQRQALTAIVNDLYGQQRALTTVIIDGAAKKFDPGRGRMGLNGAVDHWSDSHKAAVDRTRSLLDDMQGAEAFDLAMLALANRQIRGLVARQSSAAA